MVVKQFCIICCMVVAVRVRTQTLRIMIINNIIFSLKFKFYKINIGTFIKNTAKLIFYS